MFDILNSRDFYQKLLAEFDDYMENMGSARHAMNCAITAHHMQEWVWRDFLKKDADLRSRIGVGSKSEDFRRWIDSNSTWLYLVQNIANGSKHFGRTRFGEAVRVGVQETGDWDNDVWERSHLVVYLAEERTASTYVQVPQLLEVVVRFWRDFMVEHSPYGKDLPEGKTKLADWNADEFADEFYVDFA